MRKLSRFSLMKPNSSTISSVQHARSCGFFSSTSSDLELRDTRTEECSELSISGTYTDHTMHVK